MIRHAWFFGFVGCVAGVVPLYAAPPDVRARPDTVREVTLPVGTLLRVRVDRGFGSDISHTEDPVQGTLARAVVVRGTEVLPAGSAISGYVASVVRSGRVKGRGRVVVRFNRLRAPRDDETYTIRTRPWQAVAPATKKKDALTIGVPAAGGAVIGGIVGGKKG